jgi:hypothetical protein
MRFARAFPALAASILGWGLASGVTLTAAPRAARANENDLVLSRLTVSSGGSFVPDNQQFRSLVSQLGVALAPKFLTPADTLGYSGFQFSTELSYTTIDNKAAYWCATEETSSCAAGTVKPTSSLGTIGIFARKGIWLPLPSFEVGGGALHLLSSQMWAAQAYAKFAIHEGFHDWPIPSLAVRGSVSRLMGSEQLDLTIPSIDVTISKSFGIAGTVNVSPYAGWNVLWMVARSEVIDKTPNVDAGAMDSGADVVNNFVFPDQDNILRQRFFAGLKLKYYVFAFTAEAVFALSGKSVDDRASVDKSCATVTAANKSNCDATDHAKGQQTYTFSASMDF